MVKSIICSMIFDHCLDSQDEGFLGLLAENLQQVDDFWVLVMKASEEKEEKQDEKQDKKRPKPVFQESSSLYPNLIDLETELFPPP
ncbi:hypothetical protein JEQ12_005337 [Ovis aries]|uniref:Uncharacterized protein n=1 Tax=Ovis aries TaxID=9940 RepID=A0A836CZA1_SHEEP|nr:hypothetical protein JEQ12_005337 [Ovis aries]